MTIKTTLTALDCFEFWSGAKNTASKIINEGKSEEALALVEEIFPNGCTDTELNDLFWFEDDWLFEMLGIDNE